MVKRVKDDYLESYRGLIENAWYLKEGFQAPDVLEVRAYVGHSFEVLENLLLIEKNLRLLEKDKSEVLDLNFYKSLLNVIGANFLIQEFFPLSSFSPYIDVFLKNTSDMCSKTNLEILNGLKLALDESDFKKCVISMRKKDREKQVQLSRYINSLFVFYPSLLVIDLDLSYAEEWDYNLAEESIKIKNIESTQNERNELITQLKKKYKKELVGYIWKLDYSIEKNFYYNLMLFLDGQKYQNDVEIAEGIGNQWKSITEAKGLYLSKNKHKCHGVGLIQNYEVEKRKNLLKNVLYLVKTDYFIKMKLKTESGNKVHTFDRGQVPKRIQPKIS